MKTLNLDQILQTVRLTLDSAVPPQVLRQEFLAEVLNQAEIQFNQNSEEPK